MTTQELHTDMDTIRMIRYHKTMIQRLKKWFLDVLIVLFILLGLLLINRNNQLILTILAVLAVLTVGIDSIIGYGIYRGKSKFDSLLATLDE